MSATAAAGGERGLHAHVRLSRGGFALDVELAAPPGTTAVVGPNGAGKSTLVSALAGLEPLAAGRVAIDGRVWEDPADRVRLPPRDRELGVVFQSPRLLPWLDVLDNVAYGPRARGVGTAEARRRARAWLERLGAHGVAARRPSALSGGEAQRVALARALAAEPRLLLLDEPLSAQDAEARGRVRRTLAQVLAEFPGIALIVSHDPIDALTLAGHVVVLEEGRVVQDGDAESLRRRPATPWVAALAGVNLLRGRLVQAEEGFALACGDLRLAVLPPYARDGAVVAAIVSPRAITLSREPPRGSARNVVTAAVAAIDAAADRVRVTLDTQPPLTAEITHASRAGLGIAPGTRVHASIKVTEIEIVESE